MVTQHLHLQLPAVVCFGCCQQAPWEAVTTSDELQAAHNVNECYCWLQMRVMPNTPCLIGQAASAYVVGTHATDDDAQKTYALMSSVGELVALTLLDTVLQGNPEM